MVRIKGANKRGGKVKGAGKRKVKGYLTNNSIKFKSLYAKLRGQGKSKTQAAKISNGVWRKHRQKMNKHGT